MMLAFLISVGISLLFALPPVMKKFVITSLKKRITKWASSKIIIEKAKFLRAYLNINQTGLDCVELRKELDNRTPEQLEAEKIFLRVYINKAPCRIIEWEKEEEDYYNRLQATWEIGIAEYAFPRFEFPIKRTEISIYVFLPPHVSIDKDIYIDFYGYIKLKSSFGCIKKGICDTNIKIPKEKWRQTTKN